MYDNNTHSTDSEFGNSGLDPRCHVIFTEILEVYIIVIVNYQ